MAAVRRMLHGVPKGFQGGAVLKERGDRDGLGELKQSREWKTGYLTVNPVRHHLRFYSGKVVCRELVCQT